MGLLYQNKKVSSLSGVLQGFLKTYMLAYFLPSAIFVNANIFIFVPIYARYKFIVEIESINYFQNQVFLNILVSAFIGFAFMSSSSYLVKFFEGYLFRKILFFIYFPLKYFQYLRRNYYLWRIKKNYEKIKDKKTAKRYKKMLVQKEVKIKGDFFTNFSENRKELLPTSFGNIFKAFENYPNKRYGMDSVLFWPRLLKVLTPDYCERLEEANNSVIFLLVSCLLFSIMGFECLLILFYEIGKSQIVKLLMLICFLLSFSFYRISQRAAQNYGEIVKSCFDIFRYDLLSFFRIEKKLSFKEEKKFWNKLKLFILIGEVDPFSKYQTKV